jgi:hypothetical protein
LPSAAIRSLRLQLRSSYKDVSITLPGDAKIPATIDAIATFITAEKTHSHVVPVPSSSLEDLLYTVAGTQKLCTDPLVLLRQSDGTTFWVLLSDLAPNAVCINCHQLPSQFVHAATLAYNNPTTVPMQPCIMIDSSEPADLLIRLGTAPQNAIECCPPTPPSLLLVSGVAGAGKSTLISALRMSMPERLMFPTITCTAPLCWVGPHNNSNIVTSSEFQELEQAGAFMYASSMPGQAWKRWGLLKNELVITSDSLQKNPSNRLGFSVQQCLYAVVEEHPVGVLAARAAGVQCHVLHVTVPTLDVMDQRLRMSEKCYEEQQVSMAPDCVTIMPLLWTFS